MESMAIDILLGSIGVSVLTMLIIYFLNETLGELAFRLRGSFHWYMYIPWREVVRGGEGGGGYFL